MVLKSKLKHIILGVLAALGAWSYNYWGIKKDNPVEEVIEYIIEDQTGMDIDLSPEDSELNSDCLSFKTTL